MVTPRALKKVGLFQGMSNEELSRVAALCEELTYNAGELSVKQGNSLESVHIIQKGRMGVETTLPSAPKDRNTIVVDTLIEGEVYPWASLMKRNATATVRALEPTKTLTVNVANLLNLCEEDCHIGYTVMKNLTTIISSRLTRHRLALLSAISGLGEGW